MYSDESGQTLMELVVVIAVSTIVIGALVFATIASLRNVQFSKNQSQATKLAQEAIERLRASRDRNRPISNFLPVTSWNGSGSGDAIWDQHISGNTDANCETEQPGISGKCYFNISPDVTLTNIGFRLTSFPASLAEPIPPSPATPVFRRTIFLSDDLNDNKNFADDNGATFNWQNAKKATVVVKWRDFAGDHETSLTSIFRKAVL